MAYKVKTLAGISGVSVRTLHYYDEVGLLKPAYYGSNGYRLYEEEQLLTLQQILFFREIRFELNQIRKILGRSDFDKIAALTSHRQVLQKDLRRTKKLIQTIDKTIEHLQGTKKMKDQEMYSGFSPEEQAGHEKYLIDRYGDCMKESIAESHRKIKHWTKTNWEASGKEFDSICQELAGMIPANIQAGSSQAQTVIRRHFQWLKQFWTPNRESYAGHSQIILDSDLRKAYEKYHPQLPEFVAEGIKLFAERELA